MSSLIDEFERMKPVNVSDIGLRRQTFGKNARITSQGRLFGVTDEFDELLLVRGAIMENGRRMITVSKASDNGMAAVKSSAKTTRSPFVNIRNLCKLWFGDDCEKWRKKLRLVESRSGIDLYEVVDENDNKGDFDMELKQWFDEIVECVKKNNKIKFSLDDIYEFESELVERHPENNTVCATIRRTLQELRDAGLIVFMGNGQYKISAKFVEEEYLPKGTLGQDKELLE